MGFHFSPKNHTTKTFSQMPTANSSPSKWFSNKSSSKLSFPRRRSKSESSSSPPVSPNPSNLHLPQRQSSKTDKLHKVFQFLDSDDNGKISVEELEAYFTSIGETMTHDEAQKVIADHDTDGDNLLDFGDFVKLMERDGGDDQDLRRAFEMFEVEKGSGCITPKGLQKMLNRLGDTKSYDECVTMIQSFDLDGNGVLDFHEFQLMMT